MDSIVAVDTPEIEGANLNGSCNLHGDLITESVPNNEIIIKSGDAIEPIVKISHVPHDGFDVFCVYEAFVNALRDSTDPKSPIGTQEYINGYRELSKFFDQLGFVFKFVKDDVVQKLTILQHFVDNDKSDEKHFETIQGGIDYETKNNLIKTNPENFARTLLRLHRALIFIEEFLRGISDRPSTETTATIAAHAYDSTLYHHHGFFIRKTVKVGFYALPSRKQLDEAIFHGHKADKMHQYETFIKTIKQIYDTIEAYYAEKGYLQLP